MFETLFTYPYRIARYRAAPLLEDRLRYLVHYAQSGATPYTLRSIAAHQVNLCRLLDLDEDAKVSVREVEAAARAWSRPGGRNSRQPARRAARQRFTGHALQWLRWVGRLEEPAVVRHAHVDEVAAFLAWMREERGWSENTIEGLRYTIDTWFDWLGQRNIALASVVLCDIDRFIARYRLSGHYSRITIHNYACQLRTFFHFAGERGWCRPDLADGIRPLRIFPGETIAPKLTREEMVRLLASTEGERPGDRRDRAVLLLLATYGLRAGEVCGLRLDDLNWEEETLSVRRPKPGRTHRYPLSQGVGQSILHYLQEGRPARPERTLFFTLRAPIRSLTPCAIHHVVSRRLDRLGIVCSKRGPHVLRHTVAQSLLDEGLPMKTVGDYLGHRSLSSTSVYARASLESLREVAAVDLGGWL